MDTISIDRMHINFHIKWTTPLFACISIGMSGILVFIIENQLLNVNIWNASKKRCTQQPDNSIVVNFILGRKLNSGIFGCAHPIQCVIQNWCGDICLFDHLIPPDFKGIIFEFLVCNANSQHFNHAYQQRSLTITNVRILLYIQTPRVSRAITITIVIPNFTFRFT